MPSPPPSPPPLPSLLPLHLHFISPFSRPFRPRPVPQQITPLEIRVRMHDDVQLPGSPRPILFHPLDLRPVRVVEHAITRDVEALLLHILAHPAEHVPVGQARRLQESGQVVDAEMAVRAPVALAASGRVLGQDFLARKRGAAAAAPDCVAAHVAVSVAHVIPIFLVERVIRDQLEALPPEQKTVLHGEPDPLQEERVLQAAEMFQVAVLAERHVQVPHAKREMRGEAVNGGGGDGCAWEGRVGVGEGGVGSGKILGEMGEDGRQAVVFVEAGERA